MFYSCDRNLDEKLLYVNMNMIDLNHVDERIMWSLSQKLWNFGSDNDMFLFFFTVNISDARILMFDLDA